MAIQIVLLGFGVLRLAQHKEREGAGIPGGCARRRQRAGRRQDRWRRRSPWRRRPGKEEQREESRRESETETRERKSKGGDELASGA